MFSLNCWNEQSSTSKLVEVCGRRGKMRDNKFQVPSSPISTDKCSSSCLVFIRAREHCSDTLSRRRRLRSISLSLTIRQNIFLHPFQHFYFANFLWVFQFSLVQALLHTICIIMKIPFQFFFLHFNIFRAIKNLRYCEIAHTCLACLEAWKVYPVLSFEAPRVVDGGGNICWWWCRVSLCWIFPQNVLQCVFLVWCVAVFPHCGTSLTHKSPSTTAEQKYQSWKN